MQIDGGGKNWRIWRLSIDSPKFSHPNIVNTLKCNGKPTKFSHPNIVNTLKCNGKPTQFAKVLPSNYTSRVISPKFHPANILRYTVIGTGTYLPLGYFCTSKHGIKPGYTLQIHHNRYCTTLDPDYTPITH